jgi:PAS domain S-box-containing protein
LVINAPLNYSIICIPNKFCVSPKQTITEKFTIVLLNLAAMKQSKLLKKLLTASERAFITIDRQFIITDTSYGAERFSEQPYESLLNKDVRHAFPEIIGLEETFNNIWLNQATSFEMKGIARCIDPISPLYFNFYIIGTNELEDEDKNILICIEDATEVMTMAQVLLQRANESELLANALLQSKKYINKVISAMADALIVTDYTGLIKTINPATINLLGYDQSELINQPISCLFNEPQKLDFIRQKCAECISYDQNEDNCGLRDIEINCLSKNGEEILVSFSCSTIPHYQQGVDSKSTYDFVYVGRNITELKRKENELLAARHFAEQSAQAKSIFLANMSHEIRTPMNGVLGMTDLLLGTNLDDHQKDFVENIHLSGNLLLSLINRILDLSKLEEGYLELESLPMHLEQCMEEILELFALQAHTQGLELNSCFEEDLPILLMADTVRFRQIMMNLIGNAIKFTTEGEVLIKIERDREFEQTLIDLEVDADDIPSAANKEIQPVYLRFSIIDTGIGISPENQSKLFKPFSQVDTSTTRRFGGTGLGLAICRQLVELMDGEIQVISPVAHGKGSCFQLRIPFEIQAEKSLSASYANNCQVLSDRHILVVEPNQNARESIRYYLGKFGAKLAEAANVDEAVAVLETNQPIDLLLIDWKLTLDRTDFVKTVHAKKHYTHLPILALLTANQQGEIQTVMHQGFCGYITKPFKEQRLLKAISFAIKMESTVAPVSVSTRSNDKIYEQSNHSKSQSADQSANQNVTLLRLSDAKILLAEDNIVNQKVTMAYLSQLGCRTDLAENGEQVLQLMQSHDYDIVLMDCQMPLLDGYATTQAIRQSEANSQIGKHVTIIAMTANAFTEDRDRCLAVGMDDYLSKPIRKHQLKEMLERWIAK